MPKTVIVTTSDSSAGCLIQARPDAQVISMAHRVVTGPVPASPDLFEFFEARLRAAEAAGTSLPDGEEQVLQTHRWRVRGLAKALETADSVELWPDPDANSQLVFAQLVPWLASQWKRDCIRYRQFDRALGEMEPEETQELPGLLLSMPLGLSAIDAARRVWDAWRHPNPQAFAECATDELAGLVMLRCAVGRMLHELPAPKTGLGKTQMALVTFAGEPGAGPVEVLGRYARTWRAVLNYWEAGQVMMDLAHCPVPALEGIEETTFTNGMHSDRDRMDRFRACGPHRTAYGEALFRRAADYADANPINRWWGGTRLTNDTLWRWDVKAQQLLKP